MRFFWIRRAALAGLLGAGAGIVFGGGAVAQEGGLCANPQAFCQRFVTPACLDTLGAAALDLGGDLSCKEKLDAYRTCVAAAAETCGAGGKADAVGKIGGIFTISGVSAKLSRQPNVSAKTKNVGHAARGSVVRLLEHGPQGQFVRVEVLAAAPGMALRGARGWTPADAIRPAPTSAAPKPLKIGERAMVETYTITLGAQPSAEGTLLAAKGWVKRGSVVEVLERFDDPSDGPYIRFRLIEAVEGSQPKTQEAWTPEANLKRAE